MTGALLDVDGIEVAYGPVTALHGVDLSVESGRTLEEITEASRESGMRIGEIVTSVREQTHAAGHVVMLMERVRESSEEIATASEQQTQGNEVVYRHIVSGTDHDVIFYDIATSTNTPVHGTSDLLTVVVQRP